MDKRKTRDGSSFWQAPWKGLGEYFVNLKVSVTKGAIDLRIMPLFLLPIFSVFTHCPFPVPGFHPAPTLHFGVVPVWPLVAMVCFLYLRTLIDSLWNTGLMFCRVNFNWCVSDVLLMISLGLKDFERRVTELKCHCHDVRSTVYAVRMIYHCWCWPGLPGLR